MLSHLTGHGRLWWAEECADLGQEGRLLVDPGEAGAAVSAQGLARLRRLDLGFDLDQGGVVVRHVLLETRVDIGGLVHWIQLGLNGENMFFLLYLAGNQLSDL